MTFHWNTQLSLPKVWGFPKTEWGIAFIVSSDYTHFDHPDSKTVISIAVTILDQPSKITGKTANETSTRNELFPEIMRQLKESFPLPIPTHIIFTPTLQYKYTTTNDGWQDDDTAYVNTKGLTLSPSSHTIKGLYSLGTHNGQSQYKFTSMESACANGVSLANDLTCTGTGLKSTSKLITITFVVRVVLVVLVALVVFIKVFKSPQRKIK